MGNPMERSGCPYIPDPVAEKSDDGFRIEWRRSLCLIEAPGNPSALNG